MGTGQALRFLVIDSVDNMNKPAGSNSTEASPNASTYSLSSASTTSSSPANKRRSSFRKWLTNPVRKLSQSRLDKSALDKSASDMSKAGKADRKAGKFSSFKNLLHNTEDGRGRSEEQPPLAQQEDLAEEVGGGFNEQVETPNGSTSAVTTVQPGVQTDTTPVATLPAAVAAAEVNGEEAEEALDVELPPPMEIQTHSFPSRPTSQEDVPSKISSTLSLKTQSETASTADLAQEIESLVRNRMEPTDQPEISEPAEQTDGATSEEPDAPGESPGGEPLDEGEANKAKALQKRQYVILELIETEKDYVRDLGLVVEGYMQAMKEGPLPEDMAGKDKMVFGNIHQIYDWHKVTFQKEIERCEKEPERLGGIFVRYEKRLYMYVKYCENKPKSEYIVAEFIDTYFEELRQKLGHRLTLPDLLIKPVQRIMKYQLLLRDICKYTGKAGEDTGDLQKAMRVMCVVPKAANDMMSVGRLQGFSGKITAQGKLLLQDTLMVMEQIGKVSKKEKEQQQFQERRVFLFEQIIIFSEETQRKTKSNHSQPGYIYKNSVKVNKMSLNEKGGTDPLSFMLIDKTPDSDTKFIVQAQSEEMKENWLDNIRAILDMQGDFLRAIQSPIAYQKELTKELSAPEFGNLQKNSMLRKTQSQPQPQPKPNTPPLPSSGKSVRQDSQKHSRCKSVPSPLQVDLKKSQSAEEKSKSSCPTSPTTKDTPVEKLKLENKKTTPPSAGSGSPKPKRNIFEGFRNTLRPKSKDSAKSASQGNVGACGGGSGGQAGQAYANVHSMPDLVQDHDPARTGAMGSNSGECKSKGASKQGSTDSSDMDQSPDGSVSVAKVLSDYAAVREDEISVSKGENVQILSSNQQGMVLVHRAANDASPAAEGWIPSTLLGQKEGGDNGYSRKPWHSALKIKKPSFRSEKKSSEKGNSLERKSKREKDEKGSTKHLNTDCVYEEMPSFIEAVKDVTVQVGEMAVLTCKVCGKPKPTISWKGPDQAMIAPGPCIEILYTEDGTASLQLHQVTPDQSGEYTCIAGTEAGPISSTGSLTVLDKPDPPARPIIREQHGTTVCLQWAAPSGDAPVQGYTLQVLEQGSGGWETVAPHCTSTTHVVGDLTPGATYLFRVCANNAAGQSQPSEPCEPIIVPTESELSEREESGRIQWKMTFEDDFSEVGEIARGRFSVVRKCIHKATSRDVAAKFISKKVVTKEGVETEFNTLQSLQHPNLIVALDLYETATSHLLILELLPSGRLFDYICCKPHFDELQAAGYTRQLLDVTQYLHNCRIAHLDIKPENLLVDLSSMAPLLKLVDLGDARHIYNNYYVHPLLGSPEFASPELVSGTPVGLLTDIWSIGVVVYVMLSGVSPFLDESLEETCSNIVRTDYCFPDEYWAGISQEARDFTASLLIDDINTRPTAQTCMDQQWIKKAATPRTTPTHVKPITTARLSDFIERRKHQNNDACRVSPVHLF